MNIPKDLLYSKSHEWVKATSGKRAQIGLTDYAQKELGDIVFINLPQEGDEVMVDEPFSDVESVKAVSDVFSPVTATVYQVNQELLDSPELINQSPYEAWIIEVEGITQKDELLTPEEYEELISEEE